MKCFAESQGLRRQLNPALVKLGLPLTSVGSGLGCIYVQYPYTCDTEHFLSNLLEL